jgi:cytochrome c oxidase subunit II
VRPRWIAIALLAGCDGAMPALAPAGPGAARIADLWWLMLGVTGAGAAIAIGALVWAALRRRARDREAAPPSPGEDRVILILGGAVPAAILLGLLVASFRVGAQVAHPPGEPAVTIDVIGHQFWWEVRYPDHGVVTANEIHVPAGAPVRLRLTSADVIHSFWVPELHGKMDLLPGKLNEFWIQADAPGVYRGQCAEFCGVQHALMALLVVAEPPGEFDAWLAGQRRLQEPPDDPVLRRGLEVFVEARCVACHAVRGVTPPLATGQVGPDLTHLASRRTLGAAILENNRGNLAGWILDPQPLKPGNRMPASPLEPDELHALLAWLETLR